MFLLVMMVGGGLASGLYFHDETGAAALGGAVVGGLLGILIQAVYYGWKDSRELFADIDRRTKQVDSEMLDGLREAFEGPDAEKFWKMLKKCREDKK